ncbi:hypothetical protein Cst_c08050 [Thermoclostridium stercorarium subsp. stercorarium DSM 8532]|uniref:ABC-2 transporter permease n=2 Tax=Thermoclostridium stercorarium TaxID=1510 RepID=L7VM37_THES1|nr:ABC-2 transporter permease [Thermoclostridium stercorarium]AGC67807.1 hypothetical protein Cst_c08050 [Thermoclostridium stercorarium subsp. stercorarium DSM 8532]AGI38850.1 ABC transporter [Thermoclostridium stercorarium subsp. stercorarium DSM 8532]ANW98208.1 hypothetical protein CSTERTH_03730 [Thermoclostridium stercorarium subsp. thermolacticum DSM 2910]
MKGLILKDLYNLKKQNKIILILVIFYLIISLTSNDPSFFGGILTFLMVMLVINSIAYDEKSKWESYALTMPVSRSDLVLSKYILGVLLLLVAFAANFVFRLATGANLAETLAVCVVTLLAGLFAVLLILPFLFKFGVEKGRYIIILIFFILTMLVTALGKTGFKLSDEFLSLLPVLSILVIILAGVISVAASLAIYKNKEM